MNTRRYRIAHIIANLEATFDGDRQRLAQAERAAAGIAAIEPAELAALFAECPWRAWAALATLSERQLIVEAIDYASYLAEQGIDKDWRAIVACWRRRLAERAAEAEALLALAEAGAFDRDTAAEDAAREMDGCAQRAPTCARTVQVESSKRDGTMYTVAVAGRAVDCPSFRFRGYCRHATAQAEVYYQADHYDRRAA